MVFSDPYHQLLLLRRIEKWNNYGSIRWGNGQVEWPEPL